MSGRPHPCFSFFPALPTSRDLELGDWIIGTPPDDVAWRSPEFKELAEKLLISFATGNPRFEGSAVMWHRTRGFDGTPPSADEFTAIQAAVRFAAGQRALDAAGDGNARSSYAGVNVSLKHKGHAEYNRDVG